MAPKKQPQGKSKADKKLEKKIIEDKTFGLKNKNKSAKIGKYVEQVKTQVTMGNSKEAKLAALEKERVKAAKEAMAAHQALVATLTTPVATGRLAEKAEEQKSTVCEYFKRGICAKGKKCKFSHDLSNERVVEKIDLYSDLRDEGKREMDDWDEAKLNDAIETKHGEGNKRCQSNIVCKHFLEAIENRRYGYFWECPNGGRDCQYRHALPPGFVLKSQKREMENEEEDKPTIEAIIEEERAKIKTFTPVTPETFAAWKAQKILEKQNAAQEVLEKQMKDAKGGRQAGMSGKNLFEFDPTLFEDDELAQEEYVRTERVWSESEDEASSDDGGAGPADAELFAGEDVNFSDEEDGGDEGGDGDDGDEDEEEDEEGDGGGESEKADKGDGQKDKSSANRRD